MEYYCKTCGRWMSYEDYYANDGICDICVGNQEEMPKYKNSYEFRKSELGEIIVS
jgi:hypothetical protein